VNKYKTKIADLFDRVQLLIRGYFAAEETDSEEARKKHKRVAVLGMSLILFLVIASVFVSEAIDHDSNDSDKGTTAPKAAPIKKVDIKNLASGASNEQIWLEGAEKELLGMQQQQKLSQESQEKLQTYVDKETISKKELGTLLKEFEDNLSKKYEAKLERELSQMKQTPGTTPTVSGIEVTKANPKVKIKKIGNYIPAGSYVEAKMISGVDAGIGVSAEADPRQVLLRVTGKVISAGFGKDYLTTERLLGCIVQCQAVGDLSSEKAYLKPVVITCAKSKEAIIEIPVKGYVTSNGKVGIRGEIVSREGDLVTKSFLSGLVGGIGGGVSQLYQPQYAISGGFAVKQGQADQAKSLLGSGLGSGINESSNRLSDYLIKRAEQYQPVISINEGVRVDLVFQEGFSLNEEDNAKV